MRPSHRRLRTTRLVMIGIDTNVLLRLLVRDLDAQVRTAERLIATHCSNEEPGYVSRLVIVENTNARRGGQPIAAVHVDEAGPAHPANFPLLERAEELALKSQRQLERSTAMRRPPCCRWTTCERSWADGSCTGASRGSARS